MGGVRRAPQDPTQLGEIARRVEHESFLNGACRGVVDQGVAAGPVLSGVAAQNREPERVLAFVARPDDVRRQACVAPGLGAKPHGRRTPLLDAHEHDGAAPVAADGLDPGASEVGRPREALLGLRQERRFFAVSERDGVAFRECQGFPDLSRRHAAQPVEVDDANLELLAVHRARRCERARDKSRCRDCRSSIHRSGPPVNSHQAVQRPLRVELRFHHSPASP